ncbi:MAG TPA: tRNA (N(6)-L-threonylcarbamoyladenosine(37)-C(2))-methylthiotransferase MtaB [bacterium]|nr:tRNA (N(6)-L-threonylcarbamoyladenosine(37)-C(2))-methylthiotransferase MtaB [bacterium]
MIKKIKFKILTLGCKVNQYDSAVLANLLNKSGFVNIKSDKSKVDLIIINSCSVTTTAISKDRRLISISKKKYPQAKIALIGCWPKIYNIKNLNVDLISGDKDQIKNLEAIKKLFVLDKKKISKKDFPSCFLNIIEDRSRYFIKVQDGCQQFCSYCVIPFARGPLKSRLVNEILKEISLATKNGFKEIVLSGIHLGLYGQDFSSSKENLYSLLKKILDIKNIGRIRLSSIEINEVSDDIINLIATNNKMCRHLHISLQSGSDKILKLMNRPYNTNYFNKRIKKLRKEIPDIAISTDIIVGFPGETKKDFKDTYNFAKKIAFSKIHVFSFSAHEQAPASRFLGQVNKNDIKERSLALRQLSKKLENDYRYRILKNNKILKVLIENIDQGKIKAKTEFYFDLDIDLDDFLSFYSKKLITNTTGLIGQIVDYKQITAK